MEKKFCYECGSEMKFEERIIYTDCCASSTNISDTQMTTHTNISGTSGTAGTSGLSSTVDRSHEGVIEEIGKVSSKDKVIESPVISGEVVTDIHGTNRVKKVYVCPNCGDILDVFEGDF